MDATRFKSMAVATLLAVLLSTMMGPLATYGTSSLLLSMVRNGVIPEALMPNWEMSGWLVVAFMLYALPLAALLVSPVAAIAAALVAAGVAASGISKASNGGFVFGFATLAGLLAGAAIAIAHFILELI